MQQIAVAQHGLQWRDPGVRAQYEEAVVTRLLGQLAGIDLEGGAGLAARAWRPAQILREAAVLISEVLRTKGYNVVRIHPTDSVELAVRKLAEHRIGALVVEESS